MGLSSETSFGFRHEEGKLGEFVLTVVRRPWIGRFLPVMSRSAGALAVAFPGKTVAWRELANKLDAFAGFHRAAFRGAEQGSFAAQVQEACSLGARSLWALEGVAYSHAATACRRGAWPRGLFAAESTSSLPDRALGPLHTGMGLALAVEWLYSDGADPRGFAALCADNSRKGLAPAAFEGLGFAARLVFPHRLVPLDAALAGMGPEACALFWHGVGRGSYFALARALPRESSTWKTAGEALTTPPHELGRKNALAGLAWALTVVNLRHPEVVERFLARCLGHFGHELPREASFAHGVAAAIRVWVDVVGRDMALDAFLRHRPQQPPGSALARAWDRLVLASCVGAMEKRAAPSKEMRLAELFRCPVDPVAAQAPA
jgi:hypothetical protein